MITIIMIVLIIVLSYNIDTVGKHSACLAQTESSTDQSIFSDYYAI